MRKLLLLGAVTLMLFSCGEDEPELKNQGGLKWDTTPTEDVQPTASFNCKKGDSPFYVVFTNTSKSAKNVKWDFGDGETSTSTNPTHKYSSAGSYIVTLTAYNGNKSHRITKTISFENPTDCYVTGVSYNKVGYSGYYYYSKLDDDGPWVVYNKFTTGYILVDRNNVDYMFKSPVLLNNISKHNYYTLYVYYSANSSKKGKQILCKKIYTDDIEKYPTEIRKTNDNNNTTVTVHFKWNW